MIKPLTSLRFFAALAVVYDHLGTGSHTGGLGVLFFFILSGFIITFTYSERIRSLSLMELASIYLSRSGRIFPLHIATLIAAIPLALHTGVLPEAHVAVLNALLLHSWYPSDGDYFTLNSVSWTLSIEWLFYLLFPFYIWVIRKTCVENSYAGIAAVFFVPLFIITVVSTAFYKDIVILNYYWWLLKISPIYVLVFISGSAAGMLYMKQPKCMHSRTTASMDEVLALSLVAVLYVLLVPLGYGRLVPFDYTLIFIIPFSFCIFAFAKSKGALSAVLSTKPLVFLGNLSFSLYMVHQLVIRYMDSFAFTASGAGGTVEAKLLAVAISIAISYLTYTYIESPFRAFAKRFAAKNIRGSRK